jgi:replication initiator protein RepSA
VTRTTIGMPDGVIYKPCGNRRATTCPGCAETYRRDAYHRADACSSGIGNPGMDR